MAPGPGSGIGKLYIEVGKDYWDAELDDKKPELGARKVEHRAKVRGGASARRFFEVSGLWWCQTHLAHRV